MINFRVVQNEQETRPYSHLPVSNRDNLGKICNKEGRFVDISYEGDR